MAINVFSSRTGTTTRKTENYSTDAAVVTINGTSDPILMLNISLSFSRQATPIFPINESGGTWKKLNLYGAADGQLTIGGMYSPTTKAESTIAALDTDAGVTVEITPVKGGEKYTLTGVSLASIGLQLSGGAASLCTVPLTCKFTELTVG